MDSLVDKLYIIQKNHGDCQLFVGPHLRKPLRTIAIHGSPNAKIQRSPRRTIHNFW